MPERGVILRSRRAAVLGGLVLSAAAGAVFVLQPRLTVAAIAAVVLLATFVFVPTKWLGAFWCSAAVLLVLVMPLSGILPVVPFAIALWVLVHRLDMLRQRSPWLAVALLAFVAHVAFLTALDPGSRGIGYLVQFLFVGGGFAILGACLRPAEWQVVRVVLIVACSVLAAYAVFEVLTHRPAIWGYQLYDVRGNPLGRANEIFGDGVGRASATLTQPLLLAFVLTAGVAAVVSSRLALGARFGLIAVLIAGLLASGSRSALLISILLVVWTGGRVVTRVFLGAAGGALVLSLVLSGSVAEVLDRLWSSNSLLHRQSAIEYVPKLLADQDAPVVVFGDGLDAVNKLFASGFLQFDVVETLDNQWVTLLCQVGLVGLGVFLLIVGMVFRRLAAPSRLLFVAVLGLFLSFEVLVLAPSLGLFAVLLGRALADESSEAPGSEVGNPAEPVAGTARHMANA